MTRKMLLPIVAVIFLTVEVSTKPTDSDRNPRQNMFGGNFLTALQTNINRNFSEEINFHLYTKTNLVKSYQLKLENDQNVRNSPFNNEYPTKVYIHGWLGKKSDPVMRRFVEAYLNGTKNYNVIVVEWKAAIDLNFFDAAAETETVGEELADLLTALQKVKKLQLQDVHLFGFSLGAHVAGVAGNNLNRKIGRITGLDPAGPRNFDVLDLFNDTPETAIDSSDAKFVDIIHTNALGLGMTRSVGHVDYYINGGVTQDDCAPANLPCSHGRVTDYMIQFILNPKAFPNVYECDDWTDAVDSEDCTDKANFCMGEVTDERGVYYVETI